MDQDTTWYGGGLDPSDIVLDGDQFSSTKRGYSPPFSAYVYCGQTAGWIKMPLGMEVGLGPGHIVRAVWRPPAPSPSKKRTVSQFSAHVCCGQTAGWIKIPLGTKVGLGPGNIVIHGDPALSGPPKGHSPQFSAHVYCGQTVAQLSYC